MEIQKRCKYCGRTFIAHKMNTIYCSPSCNNKDYKRAIREKQIAEFMEEKKEDLKSATVAIKCQFGSYPSFCCLWLS